MREALPPIAGAIVTALFASSAGAQRLGVYEGSGCSALAGVARFEAFIGRPVDFALDFLPIAGWTEIKSNARWSLDCWRRSGKSLVLSVPLVPRGGTLGSAAGGDYDHEFEELGAIIVGGGYGGLVIRLGWEFNGDWNPWSGAKDPAQFIAAWRRAVTALRRVEGQRFQFDWSAALGQPTDPERLYPGDAFVDMIGIDLYDQSWSPNARTPDARWTNVRTSGYGLDWFLRFAETHGRPVSFPEWGVGTRPDGHGGGDDPLFVREAAAVFMRSHAVYQSYWDYQAPDFDGRLSDGRQTAAAQEFRRLFGAQRSAR